MTALLSQACAALGIVFALLALAQPWRLQRQRRRHAHALRHWVRADAVVLESAMRRTAHGQTLTGAHHHPQLRYAFHANGVRREGTRVSLFDQPPFEDEALAETWLAGHAPGRKVAVWYDPRDPSSCALALDAPPMRDALVTGVVLAALSLALLATALSM